ncbi:unnamed protein product [Onchocerca ochengi]|uniref:PDEase domain-containing protein n=1 Tax=Onchocerca ochengi TaxID=42157 RepID=A0A182EJB2_ONCOC|nr:unnamed protein product [Onchocerca ochengi]
MDSKAEVIETAPRQLGAIVINMKRWNEMDPEEITNETKRREFISGQLLQLVLDVADFGLLYSAAKR